MVAFHGCCGLLPKRRHERCGAIGVSADDDLDFDDSLFDTDDTDVTGSGIQDDGAGAFAGGDADSSGQTVSEMMAAAASSSGGSSGQSGAAKRVRKLAGRLGFGDGAAETGSIESRLTSVVSESTPGPALDLLRGNKAFALPGLDASVMLVLPTTGEFGGLNKRTRSEDKGQFIQMINTELIDTVVTNELLADDALGLVPTVETLSRMKEFGMLTSARYVYGIACADVDSGGVKVFSVPAATEEDGTVGKVFAKAEAVSAGQEPLSSLVDPRVAAAMLAIYRDPTLDPGEGDRLLDEAVQANMELTIDAVARGRYPTAGELVANLAERFPSAGIRSAAAQHQGSADGLVVSEPSPRAKARAEAETETEAETEVVAAAYSASNETDTEASTDTEQESGHMAQQHEAAAEPDFTQDASEPDFGDDTEGPDFSAPAATGSRSGSGMAISDEAALRSIFEAIDALRHDVRSEHSKTASGVPVGAPTKTGPATVIPGSDFTYEQALDSAGRRYVNDELELFVDASPFVQRLTWAAPSLDIPITGVTPWLGEQVQTWVGVLDQSIKAHHEESIRNLYRRYTQLADQAAATTNAEFDARGNPNSQWGAAFAALERDRISLADRMSEDRLAAENKARDQWGVRRKAYVEDAAARAGQEFDHRNATRIEADVRDAGERIIAGGEALHERNLADFNAMRRRAAHEFMDRQLSGILAQLDQEAATMQRMNTEMVEAAVASVEGYLEEHRQKDLDQAEIVERKLEADNRLEQARQEASAEIRKIRAEADDRVKAMAEDVRRRADETVEQLKINDETNRLNLAREQARVRALESQLNQTKDMAEANTERLETHYLQEVESVKRDAQQSRADRDRTIAEQRRRSSMVFWMMAIGLLLAIVLGGLAGFVLASGGI